MEKDGELKIIQITLYLKEFFISSFSLGNRRTHETSVSPENFEFSQYKSEKRMEKDAELKSNQITLYFKEFLFRLSFFYEQRY